jgi:HEAT repeat protein
VSQRLGMTSPPPRAALAVFLLSSAAACERTLDSPKNDAVISNDLPYTTTSSSEDAAELQRQLEMHLTFLMDPLGDAPNVRQRQQSTAWLLAHPDLSYPRLLAALQSNPAALDAPAIIEILPGFGRADSVSVLAQALEGGTTSVASSAGDALAHHPDPSARAALLRALRSSRAPTLVAAADGLYRRGDPSACVELKPLIAARDPVLRSSAVRATATLGCLSKAELDELAKTDTDPNVRALAQSLVAGATR